MLILRGCGSAHGPVQHLHRALAVLKSLACAPQIRILRAPGTSHPPAPAMSNATSLDRGQLAPAVRDALARQPIVDMHTHLYPPGFGTPVPNATGRSDPAGLMLWGVDELLTYHYLVAEVFRVVPATKLPYEEFWRMPKTA